MPKATLLAAACRAIGIPARVGFADVRNHLSTARMREVMQTDVFYWHGYAVLLLDGAWRKATPAFNRELCERFDLLPLEFDGRADSLYHPFDRQGHRHMEYLADRGSVRRRTARTDDRGLRPPLPALGTAPRRDGGRGLHRRTSRASAAARAARRP